MKMLPSKVVSTFTDTVYTDGSAPTHDGCANLLLLQKFCRKLRKNERRRGRAPLAWIRHCGTSLLKKIIMCCNIFNALFFSEEKKEATEKAEGEETKEDQPEEKEEEKEEKKEEEPAAEEKKEENAEEKKDETTEEKTE